MLSSIFSGIYSTSFGLCEHSLEKKKTLRVGGAWVGVSGAGLGGFASAGGVSFSSAGVGFRSVSLFVSLLTRKIPKVTGFHFVTFKLQRIYLLASRQKISY